MFYSSSCSCCLFFSFVHFYFYLSFFFIGSLSIVICSTICNLSLAVSLFELLDVFVFSSFGVPNGKIVCVLRMTTTTTMVSSPTNGSKTFRSDLNRNRLTFRSNHSASVGFSHTNFTLPIDFSFNDLVLVYIVAVLILLRCEHSHTHITWRKGHQARNQKSGPEHT